MASTMQQARIDLEKRLETAQRNDSYNESLPCQIPYNECQSTFSKIIDATSTMAVPLRWVKDTYDTAIGVLQEGCRARRELPRDLEEEASYDTSMQLLTMREDELKQRIAVVLGNTTRLEKKLQRIQEETARRMTKYQRMGSMETMRREKVQLDGAELSVLSRTLPGGGHMDINKLDEKLQKLKSDIKSLEELARSNLRVPKSRGAEQEEKLTRLEEEKRVPLSKEMRLWKSKILLTRIAQKAIAQYDASLVHADPTISVTDYILQALENANPSEYYVAENLTDLEDFHDDEKVQSQQAALQAVDDFNRLMEDKRYREAASLIVIRCPSFMRTVRTMHRFADAEPVEPGEDPFLIYCDALVTVQGAVMDEEEAIMACTTVLGRSNMLKEVEKWWIKRKLTPSPGLANLLVSYAYKCDEGDIKKRSLRLAEGMFFRSGAITYGLICILHQGQLQRMMSLAKRVTTLTRANIMDIVRNYPEPQFSLMMMSQDAPCRPPLTAAEVMSSILQVGNVQSARTVAQSVFGAGYEKLLDYVLDDRHTAQSEWLRLADMCCLAPQLHDLGQRVTSCCLTKFAIIEASAEAAAGV